MFAFAGKVVAAQRLRNNYLSLAIQREREGLLGPTIQVLVPTLVQLRDGAPQIGSWTWVDAMPAQAVDFAEGLRGFDFVASRLTSAAERAGQESGHETPDIPLDGPMNKQAILP